METWSDDELLARWNRVAVDFQKAVDEISPQLIKISKMEKELIVLRDEIMKRGISDGKENG